MYGRHSAVSSRRIAAVASARSDRGQRESTFTASNTYLALFVLLATYALTLTTGVDLIIAPVVAAAFLFVVVARERPNVIIHLLIMSTVLARTENVPRGFRLGVFVYFQEVLIFGGVVYALWTLRQSPELTQRLSKSTTIKIGALFCALVLFGVTLGVVRNHPLFDVQFDARSLIDMLLVAFIATVIAAADDLGRYVKTVAISLFFSVILMVYASATSMALSGRTETAQLYAEGGRRLEGGSDAVRYLSDTTAPALAIILACTALLLFDHLQVKFVLWLYLPSIVITLLAFSRISVLALGGTVFFAGLVALFNQRLIHLVRRLAVAPVVLAVVVAAILGFGQLTGAGNWIETQATGYANRVFAGLEESNERVDTSITYREQENEFIRETGAKHPFIGGGFGQQYKPASGDRDSFRAIDGRLYTHNFYNWLYIKIGLIGLAVFIALMAACVVPALIRRHSNRPLAAAASALVGMCLAMLYHPMAMDVLSYSTVGVVIGICIGSNTFRRSPPMHQSTRSSTGENRVRLSATDAR